VIATPVVTAEMANFEQVAEVVGEDCGEMPEVAAPPIITNIITSITTITTAAAAAAITITTITITTPTPPPSPSPAPHHHYHHRHHHRRDQ